MTAAAPAPSVTREDVDVPSSGTRCAGWFYRPDGLAAPAPAIAMAHGFTGVKEMELDAFARRFAAAGFVTLLFDYRGFGLSDGAPRQHLDPRAQIDDYRAALSWLADRPEVDAARMAVWGTSYSGGHVLHLGAYDRRVKAVVAQVPFVDGLPTAIRVLGAERFAQLRDAFGAERNRPGAVDAPAYIPVVAPDGAGPSAIPQSGPTAHLLASAQAAPSWENRITLTSIEHLVEYAPGASVHRISPTPLLMLIAGDDTLTPTDLALEAYNRALEPKRVELIALDGHHGIYDEPARTIATDAAIAWFTRHLGTTA